jgi:hypothetical protein
MKPALLLLPLALSLTGCTTATNYTQSEYEGNNNNPPKMFLGIMKVYPEGALKILSTPPVLATNPPGTSTVYSTTTIRDNKGNVKTYSTTTTIRSR